MQTQSSSIYPDAGKTRARRLQIRRRKRQTDSVREKRERRGKVKKTKDRTRKLHDAKGQSPRTRVPHTRTSPRSRLRSVVGLRPWAWPRETVVVGSLPLACPSCRRSAEVGVCAAAVGAVTDISLRRRGAIATGTTVRRAPATSDGKAPRMLMVRAIASSWRHPCALLCEYPLERA